MIPTTTLGRSGLEVTRLGYGSMGLRGPRTWGKRVVDEASAEKFLHAVLDAGINFIDTSPDYGIAEQRIGDYLSSRRDEFYLATKCGCVYTQRDDHLELDHIWKRDVIQRNLETSLQRLKTDCIDVLQFHGGDAETLQAEGLIDQLCEWKSQGIVRFIGVSSKLPNLPGLVALDVFDTIQAPYSCLAPEHAQTMARAAELGKGVIVRGGIGQGGPDAEIQRPALNEVWDRANLAELLPEGTSPAELILRHTLSHQHNHCVIVGTCNHQHLAENVAAAQAGPLPDDLRDEIDRRVQEVS